MSYRKNLEINFRGHPFGMKTDVVYLDPIESFTHTPADFVTDTWNSFVTDFGFVHAGDRFILNLAINLQTHNVELTPEHIGHLRQFQR